MLAFFEKKIYNVLCVEVFMERQFVAFKIASSFYCIDIMEVQEVIRQDHITVMPNFPSFVEGVINLRGTITPLLSIDKRLLELSKDESDFSKTDFIQRDDIPSNKKTRLKLIIVNVGSFTIGLLADTLDKIITVDEHQIQNAEGLGRFAGHKMVAGILQIDEEIYTVLNPSHILDSGEAQQLSESLNK